MIDNRLAFPKKIARGSAFMQQTFWDRRRWSHFIRNDPESDFKMVYYNSDGSQSTMCGNGGRCLVAFAKKLKTIGNSARFNAVDGLHHATIKDDGIVSLQMIDVLNIKKVDYTFLDTGSPHHVQIVEI
jgi:diaminopimelate epimerase